MSYRSRYELFHPKKESSWHQEFVCPGETATKGSFKEAHGGPHGGVKLVGLVVKISDFQWPVALSSLCHVRLNHLYIELSESRNLMKLICNWWLNFELVWGVGGWDFYLMMWTGFKSLSKYLLLLVLWIVMFIIYIIIMTSILTIFIIIVIAIILNFTYAFFCWMNWDSAGK